MKRIVKLLVLLVLGWYFLIFIFEQSQLYFTGEIWEGRSKREVAEKTGNDLIDNYGENNEFLEGENGRGILLVAEEKEIGDAALKSFRVNNKISDLVPLNRKVPDSRPLPCRNLIFDDTNLPKTAVVIPFHDEWPSILLRTVYSLINRTPRHLLKEIILVDDASSLESLKEPLDKYIETHFPHNLIKMVRLNNRSGIIKARLQGFNRVTAEVVCFFDSHMEVNIDWSVYGILDLSGVRPVGYRSRSKKEFTCDVLPISKKLNSAVLCGHWMPSRGHAKLQPLLVEIRKNRRSVVMSQLDYIKAETFQYTFTREYKPRYGFNWKLVFFEDLFQDDQIQGKQLTEAFPGVVMVGAGFAIDAAYFKEIGTYDDKMKIWGGENLELSWRVSMCGGQVIHLFCSHIGHISRVQPYVFPEGRLNTEVYNYKRAVDVWLGPYKKYVYNAYPMMKDIDVGNITDRLEIKKRLKCKSFEWYLENIWPELLRFEDNVRESGQLQNVKKQVCLDNNNHLFRHPVRLIARPCIKIYADQGFSLTNDYKIRSSLNCVGLICENNICFAYLTNCRSPDLDRWNHTQDGLLQTKGKNLCLDIDEQNSVFGSTCNSSKDTQKWIFVPIETK